MDNAIRANINIIRQHASEELAKNMTIQVLLKEYREAHPLDLENDLDLNPHLTIKHYCEQVAAQVVAEGYTCTTEDVMLMWLTTTIYHGRFLYPGT